LGMVFHTCNSNNSGSRIRRTANLRSAQAKLGRPFSPTPPKKNTNKRAGFVAQVVKHLPSMCGVLGSIPSDVCIIAWFVFKQCDF
jgi:hypothetical protein